MVKIAVFYHFPCIDGAAAAWVAYQHWGDDAAYIGVQHGSRELLLKTVDAAVDDGTDVVFADFCPHRELMEYIAERAHSVTIYDHHVSALREMEHFRHPKVRLVLDKQRSGSAIVWDELFANRPRPPAIELVQHVDLEDDSHAHFLPIAAYVDSFDMGDIGNGGMAEINAIFATMNGLSADAVVKEGNRLLHAPDHRDAIRKALDSMYWTRLQILPGAVPANVPIVHANIQQLGREFSLRFKDLARDCSSGVALSWYEDGDIVRVSVRSGGEPDASEVAAHIGRQGLGGGGHRTSAAAQFTRDQFAQQFRRLTEEEATAAPK